MKKTALASAISLAVMSGSAWAVPCDVLGPTGKPIKPFDTVEGAVCTTTTTGAVAYFDKTNIRAGETINLAILGLDNERKVDRFGEDGGSVLMAVVSTTQGLIPIGGEAYPPQGTLDSGQVPNQSLPGGSFVNRQDRPSSNPDDYATTRIVKLSNGLGEINIHYHPTTRAGEEKVRVKLQERESTPNGGIRVNTIVDLDLSVKPDGTVSPSTDQKKIISEIGLVPANSDPIVLYINEFTHGISDPAGLSDFDDSDGIHGQVTAGSLSGEAKVVITALDKRVSGNLDLMIVPVGPDMVGVECEEVDGVHTPGVHNSSICPTSRGLMVNGEAIVSLPSTNKAHDYYLKAVMTPLDEKGDPRFVLDKDGNSVPLRDKDGNPVLDGGGKQKYVILERTSVDLQTVDKVTVVPTGVPKSLSLTSNKERINQSGQGALIKVNYLDEYGNVTTNRAGSSYPVTITEASGNTLPVSVTLDQYSEHDAIVLGDVASEIGIASGVLSLAASTAGLSPSSVVSLNVVDKVLGVVVNPGFSPSATLIANNQIDALTLSSLPGTDNRVSITNIRTKEVSHAVTDPTSLTVRAAFDKVGPGPYMVSDEKGEYAQTLIDGATIIPATPKTLGIFNAHNEQVDFVPSALDLNNPTYPLQTVLPEKAVRLRDQYGNLVTGEPAGKFIVTPSLSSTVLTYPAGTASATPSGDSLVWVRYGRENAGTGNAPLTIKVTAPNFNLDADTTRPTTTLPELPDQGKFDKIVTHFDRGAKNTIPVNSRVAMSVELLKFDKVTKNDEIILDDALVKLEIGHDGLIIKEEDGKKLLKFQSRRPDDKPGPDGKPETSEFTIHNSCEVKGTDGEEPVKVPGSDFIKTGEKCFSRIISPVVREVTKWGGRGDVLARTGSLVFSEGKKVFEVNAGQVTGWFTLTFSDPSGSEEKETRIFFVDLVPEEQRKVEQSGCDSTNLASCKTEVDCNTAGGGYAGETCSDLTALGADGIDSTGNPVTVPAGTVIKGGYSVDGNPFVNPASATDPKAMVKIVGSIEPAEAHVGSTADILVLFAGVPLGKTLGTEDVFVLAKDSVLPWDGTIENIGAFDTKALEKYNVFNIYETPEGGFGVEGELYVLPAYRLENGTVVYGVQLLELTIDDPRTN